MRLLWLSHLVPYPPKGGLRQRSYYLLREAARRHEVDVAALVQSSHHGTERELAEAEEAIGRFCRHLQTFRIRSELRPWGRPLLLLRSLLSSRPYDVHWLEADSLRHHLRDLDRSYDLVHVDTIGLAPYVQQLSRIPFVLNHHNIESQMMEDRADQASNWLKRIVMAREAGKLERCERRWASLAEINTVVSPLDGERLRGRAPDADIEVVENGVDIEYFKPRSPPEDHDGYLVWVGGMSWYPNRDAMLWFVREIWPELLDDDPTRRAVLIGRDPPDDVRRAAETGQLRAPGFVDDIRPTVDRAFAYVCPIRTGGGTRLKILDALSMAKPLVATEFAVEGLGLENDRHYLKAETPAEYVRQIRRLGETPSLRHRLGTAGRELVESRYAWRVVGRNLEGAYRAAVGEG